jgi:pimeloyl-ACP methyl ester carboxylesterase
VLDAAGSRRALVFAFSEGGPIGVQLAAQHPERTLGLVLWGTLAKGVASADYPFALSQAQLTRWLEHLTAQWGGPAGIEAFAPDEANDPVLRRWWARLLRQGATHGGCALGRGAGDRPLVVACGYSAAAASSPRARVPRPHRQESLRPAADAHGAPLMRSMQTPQAGDLPMEQRTSHGRPRRTQEQRARVTVNGAHQRHDAPTAMSEAELCELTARVQGNPYAIRKEAGAMLSTALGSATPSMTLRARYR